MAGGNLRTIVFDRGEPLRVRSFPPIAEPNARVLILGSMPGAASLQAREYYAHPRNAFWRILGALLEFDPAAPYARRVDSVRAARVAIWDVLATCVRPGSLDSAIDPSSAVPNDFARFFAQHPLIEHVFFNGTTAEASFRRSVLPRLRSNPPPSTRLPSTSPAHAARSFDAKLRAWSAVVRLLAGP